MVRLSNYILENQQSHIDGCIVNEGLLKWIKKLWNRMLNSIKKNKEEHGGTYRPYNFINKEVKNEAPSNAYDFKCIKTTKAKFKKLMTEIGEIKRKTHPFYDAYEYEKAGANEDIIWCLINSSHLSDNMCVMFVANDADAKTASINKIFWNKNVEDKIGINDSYKQALIDQHVKNEIAKLFGIDETNVKASFQ